VLHLSDEELELIFSARNKSSTKERFNETFFNFFRYEVSYTMTHYLVNYLVDMIRDFLKKDPSIKKLRGGWNKKEKKQSSLDP
jgi:hypothetical protein